MGGKLHSFADPGGGGVEPGQPSYNTTATINGVSQNIDEPGGDEH